MRMNRFKRLQTDEETTFGRLGNMQLSALDPRLDRPLLDMTQQCSMKRRHLLGFRLTCGAPSNNWLFPDAGNDNLFCLNDDFGVPSTHD